MSQSKSLEEELKQIAHCPKQVTYDTPLYANCDWDCEKCANNKHSLCTSIVLEKLSVHTEKIRSIFDSFPIAHLICGTMEGDERIGGDYYAYVTKEVDRWKVKAKKEVLAELTTSSVTDEEKDTWREDLKHFLVSRETDIALDMENFGSLTDVFYRFIGRKAKEVGDKK